ncbi:NAD(P)-dependent oxidoreductase [Nisaea acidiphila]|uniref:NAD(P)-dependent oxidoreductase n=1 Tax=Nisaea acidiphila TaxID=1862145 RepID=A0A9J7APJ6_9PROT|nr:NAD(P)-dependent oxidoreductase [Nisaea acidiphila]UUX49135.1 NAD(P)-dependent oxidoreductase [Nisaea acidiphila]
MAVLILGGAGFVGLNIAETLLRTGETAVIFDRRQLPPAAKRAFADQPGECVEVVGDALEDGVLLSVLKEHQVDRMFCAAAVTAGPERDANAPRSILEVNLMAFTAALEAARDAGLTRVINVGSTAAYGSTAFGDKPLSEDLPAWPHNLYSTTKFASECITRRLADLWEMDLFSVRLSGVFGPWEVDSGLRDTLSPQMQASLIALKGGEATLRYRDMRDWTYSRDIADALVRLINTKERPYDVFNISCSAAWSTADWCEMLAGAYPDFSWRLAEENEEPTVNLHGDTDRQLLVSARLKEALGWSPDLKPERNFKDFKRWADAYGDYWMG